MYVCNYKIGQISQRLAFSVLRAGALSPKVVIEVSPKTGAIEQAMTTTIRATIGHQRFKDHQVWVRSAPSVLR